MTNFFSMHSFHILSALLTGLSSLLITPTLSALVNPREDILESRSTTTTTTTPLPPSQDPWYTAPEDAILYSSAPGSILRIRPDPFQLYASVGTNLSSASYNILYRTTDVNSQPNFAVTTLFVPFASAGTSKRAARSTSTGEEKSYGLLSYQIPYNSASVDSSPSYALATDLQSVFPDIAAALKQGWYVSVPDHEGPNATFAVGVAEGYAVLDSVRAVTQSPLSPATATTTTTTISRTTTKDDDIQHGHGHGKWNIGLWGYSGGSIASEFAAELQAMYAPDLEIAGVAIGGLPNPEAVALEAVNKSPYAALILMGLWGYSNAYPPVESYLLSRLTAEAKESGVYTKAHNMSFDEAFATYNGTDVFSYFIGGKEDVVSSPLMEFLFETQGVMGRHGLPTMPVYVYKAIADQLAPVQYVDALIEQYCGYNSVLGEKGAKILYERNTVGGHVAEMTNQDADAFSFLVKALNGKLGAGWPHGNGTGCVVKNVTVGNDTSPDW